MVIFFDGRGILKNIKDFKIIFVFKKILFKISKFIYNVCNFGIKFAWYDFLQVVCFRLPKKFVSRINKKRLKYLKSFLEKKYSKFINDYKTKEILIGRNDKKIRILWWQGVEKAPKLIKRCIKSVKEHNCGYEVILLDKNNYNKYIELPDFIIKKVKKKKITLTHLSDIIRIGLLKKYGGIWIDATVFVNSDVFKSFNDVNLNSISADIKGSIPRWGEIKRSVRLIGGKSNRLFNFCYDFFMEYRKDYNHIIDYYLIDCIISIAYDHFKDCRKDINNITNVNHQVYKMRTLFNEKYSEDIYRDLMKISFSKLSLKEEYIEEDKDGYQTIYGKFVQE